MDCSIMQYLRHTKNWKKKPSCLSEIQLNRGPCILFRNLTSFTLQPCLPDIIPFLFFPSQQSAWKELSEFSLLPLLFLFHTVSKLTSFTSTPETDGLHAVYWSMRLVLFPSVFQVPGAYNSYLSQSWYLINVYLMNALMYLQYYQMSQFSANLFAIPWDSQCWNWNCSLSYTYNTPCSNYRSKSLSHSTLFTATFFFTATVSRHTKQHLPSFYGITKHNEAGRWTSPYRTDSGESLSCFFSVLSIASSLFQVSRASPSSSLPHEHLGKELRGKGGLNAQRYSPSAGGHGGTGLVP